MIMRSASPRRDRYRRERRGLGVGVIAAAVLGLLVATAFWLAYFDFFTIRGEQLLTDRSGVDRVALARDIYTYLHLPMIAGIVLFAFAMKPTLAHVSTELDTVPAFALCVGPALYLSAYVALRVRVSRTIGRGRVLAARGLRVAVAGRDGRAGARRARARGGGLGRAPRVRAHLVARGTRTRAGDSPARVGFVSARRLRCDSARADRAGTRARRPRGVSAHRVA